MRKAVFMAIAFFAASGVRAQDFPGSDYDREMAARQRMEGGQNWNNRQQQRQENRDARQDERQENRDSRQEGFDDQRPMGRR